MSGESRTGPEVPGRPRSRDDVVFRELADDWVLFDPDSRRLHVLNLTAALVWSHCTGEHGVDEITRRVRRAFDDPPDPEDVAEDVREALRSFVRQGLLERGRPEPGERESGEDRSGP